MFTVYTRDGEFELPTAEEVRRLFDHHRFRGAGDYFTIGRGGVDYLEIYAGKQGFLLAYIGPDDDESSAVADDAPREEIVRVVDAFCAGAVDFLAPLRAADAAGGAAPLDRPAPPAGRAPRREASAENLRFDARPIEPERFAASPLIIAAIVLLLCAAGAAAAWLLQSAGK